MNRRDAEDAEDTEKEKKGRVSRSILLFPLRTLCVSAVQSVRSRQ